MSFSSDDSLGDLPLPYDISTAVSRALRINSTGSTSPDDGTKVAHPSNSLTAVDASSHAIKAHIAMPQFNRSRQPSSASYVYENTLQPNFTPTGLHHYPNPGQPAIYDQFGMEAVDAWSDNTVTVSICRSSESMLDSQNDMEQLDQFCSYIVSNSDEELPLENNSSTGQAASAAPIYPSNAFPGPAYYYQYPPMGIESPPRKKQRSTSSYREYHYPTSCSSTESSPEKCAGVRDAASWRIKLENLQLWRQFDQIGTEMVITKGGR